MALRSDIVGALDEYLDIGAIEDGALNGLQVEGGAEVVRVATAVDAAQATIAAAVDSDCQLLVVHHGLFWGAQVPLCGIVGRRVRACFAADLSVYAAHLPLDAHAEVGNNILLARRLGRLSTAPSVTSGASRSARSRASRSLSRSARWPVDSPPPAATSR